MRKWLNAHDSQIKKILYKWAYDPIGSWDNAERTSQEFIRHVLGNEIKLKATKLHIIKTTKQEEERSKQNSYDPLDISENVETERNETKF